MRIRLNLGDIFDNVYERLIDRIDSNYEEAIGVKQVHEIERDVGRTFDRFKGRLKSYRPLRALPYTRGNGIRATRHRLLLGHELHCRCLIRIAAGRRGGLLDNAKLGDQ